MSLSIITSVFVAGLGATLEDTKSLPDLVYAKNGAFTSCRIAPHLTFSEGSLITQCILADELLSCPASTGSVSLAGRARAELGCSADPVGEGLIASPVVRTGSPGQTMTQRLSVTSSEEIQNAVLTQSLDGCTVPLGRIDPGATRQAQCSFQIPQHVERVTYELTGEDNAGNPVSLQTTVTRAPVAPLLAVDVFPKEVHALYGDVIAFTIDVMDLTPPSLVSASLTPQLGAVWVSSSFNSGDCVIDAITLPPGAAKRYSCTVPAASSMEFHIDAYATNAAVPSQASGTITVAFAEGTLFASGFE